MLVILVKWKMTMDFTSYIHVTNYYFINCLSTNCIKQSKIYVGYLHIEMITAVIYKQHVAFKAENFVT